MRLPRISLVTILVLIAVAGGTFVAWRLAKASDRSHIRRVTRLTAVTMREDLTSDMHSWVRGQVRLAKLWEFEEPTHRQWTAFAELSIEHHPGCLAIEWIDPKYEEQWVTRSGPAKAVAPSTAETAAREALFRNALQSGTATLSPVFLSSSGEEQWLTVVPIYHKQQFRGFVLAAFDVRQALDEMLADIAPLPFSASLEQGGNEIYRLRGDSNQYRAEWTQTTEAMLPGVTWRLHVWPNAEVMEDVLSNLPPAILIFGGVLSVLLALLVHTNERLRRQIVQRRHAEDALRASQARFAGILEISAEGIISTDATQRITLYNRAAEAIFGYTPAETIGRRIEMLIPERFRAIHKAHFDKFANSSLHNMLMSERGMVFGRRKDGSEFPMAASISKLELGEEKVLTVICSDATEQVRAAEELRRTHDELEVRVHERTADLERSNQSLQSEIAERKLAEEAVRVLSGRLMRVQDEQRRQLARELHDGATQNLVSVALNLSYIGKSAVHDADLHARIEECMELIQSSTNELRTISYLLHPPLLEELGLVRTLRSYIDGFSKRSGIATTFATPEERLGALESQLELTVFRIVQESLSNIHRHSGSLTARVGLARQGDNLVLEISDQGRGIQSDALEMGVGIASMKERVRLMGGELEIKTGPSGTTICAILPLLQAKPRTSGTAA